MNPRHPTLLLLLPLLLASTGSPQDDPDALVRRGNLALHRKDYPEAVLFYERAQRRSLQPSLVAFNLATALYQQAGDGAGATLGRAETEYRACLGKEDPRRAAALLGLGNCLLLRGRSGGLDALSLRASIDRFQECLRDPTCTPELTRAAFHNRERARLLLLQVPPQAQAPQGDPGTEESPEEKQSPTGPRKKGEQRTAEGTPTSDPSTVPPEGSPDGRTGSATETRPTPGKGTLPPVPSSAEAPSLAEGDALRHLDRAVQRIQEEGQRHRRSRTRVGSPGVLDW
ncbi:MAG: tetratricopeptide repeat protein [Gemmataceae bacterium]